MPRPKRPRETQHPFGQKLNAVMAEKGIAGDYAALAREFGVQPASTKDWVLYGRFSKEHFRRLVEWSGRSLHWWFDVPQPDFSFVTSDNRVAHVVIKDSAPELAAGGWPFSSLTRSDWDDLSFAAKHAVEAFARATLEQERQQRKKAPELPRVAN